MLAFADRTPPILRYYEDLAKAQARRKNLEMEEPESAADDLMRIYQEKELEKKRTWE